MLAAKQQNPAERALIEVWREGDRVMIGMPSAEDRRLRADDPAVIERELQETRARLRSLHQTDAGQAETEMFGLSEEEWLSANLLALRHEAVARARSLDDTLAYVTGKCAAVRGA